MDGFLKAFLQSEASRNPVLSGYVAAVVGSLLGKKHAELLAYFFADPQLPELFLARLEVSSLLDLLRSFLSLDSDDHFEAFDADLDAARPAATQPFAAERARLFARLRQAYRTSHDPEVKQNLRQLFCSLTRDLTPFFGAEPQLLAMLYGDPGFFQHLFEDAAAPGADRLGAKASAGLLAELLGALYPGRKFGDSLAQQMNSYVLKQKLAEQVATRVRTGAFEAGLEAAVCGGLRHLAECLVGGPLPQAVNSAGAETRVLDSHRLALCEVLLAALQLDSDAVDRAVLGLELLPRLTVASAQQALLAACPWNSLLHTVYGKCLKHLLAGPRLRPLCAFVPPAHQLLEDAWLVRRLQELYDRAAKDRLPLPAFLGLADWLASHLAANFSGDKDAVTKSGPG